jgi:hypothetical protein
MAKLTEISIRVKHGETVYVIDDYEERAMCFAPKLGQNVLSKRKGNGVAYKRPLTDKLIIESVFSGEEVSKEDYDNY